MKSIQLYLVAFLFFFSAQFSFAQHKHAPKPPQNTNAKVVKQETKADKTATPQRTAIKKAAPQNVSKKTSVKKLTKQIGKKEDQPSVVTINDKEYFTINSVWFTKEKGKYIKVDKPQEQQTTLENKVAPVSKQEAKLTSSNEPAIITHNDQKYHVFRGYWFIKDKGEFTKVKAPIGAQLMSLPQNVTEEVLNGETYYTFENTRYKKVGGFYEVVAF